MPTRSDMDRMTNPHPDDASAGFAHDALIYGSDDEYVDAVVPFLEAGLSAGETVRVVSTPHNTALLQAAMGQAGASVEFASDTSEGGPPARKIALLHELCDDDTLAGNGRSRLVGEARFGATTREHLDWVRYEAILNEVFASTPQWFICAYDRRELPDWVIQAAGRTHPHVRSEGRRVGSSDYDDPATVAQDISEQLTPLPVPSDRDPILVDTVDLDALASVRARLAWVARESTGSRDRADDVTMGLNEIVTNALEHGSERARVRCWRDTRRLVVEVTDEGPGFDDPLAGYWPPSPEQVDGRGLWLARQTLDALEWESRSDAGMRARAAVKL